MKKSLFYILALALILGAQLLSSSVFAAETTTPEVEEYFKDPIDELISEANKKKNKFLAHDMYYEIYKKSNQEPNDNAIKNIAQKYGLSEKQVRSLVQNGDISSLSAKKDLTQDQLAIQYSQLVNAYNTEVEAQKMKTQLLAKTSPSEIFADNNTSNSDFDVIHDLTIIEKILFNEDSGTNGQGGEFVAPPINIVDEAEQALKEILTETDDTDNNQYLEVPESDSGLATEHDENAVDPLSCLDGENSLADSLQEYEDTQEAQGGDENDGDGSGDDGDGNGDNDGDLEGDNFPKAVADNWSMEDLCPDGAFFCIDIEFVVKQSQLSGGSFFKSKCTKCHISAINAELDKVLSKPVTGNKLTGNLMEMPKCKNIQLPANMKIVTIAVPAPQTTTTFNAKIEDSWKKFLERTGAYGYKKTPAAEAAAAAQPAPSVADNSAKQAAKNNGPNATGTGLATTTASIANQISAQVSASASQQVVEKQAEKRNRFYQSIMKEFNTMNIYFANIKDTFEKMKTPCQALSNKGSC